MNRLRRFCRSPDPATGSPRPGDDPAGRPDRRARARDVVDRLATALGTVTIDDFRLQETRYDLDSRLGRELLYLIANDEWVHTTTEVLDLNKATTVDTTIRVEVDLDRLTHEAFRESRDQVWLPLLVLPPRVHATTEGRRLTAAVPIVTDGSGEVLSTVPQLQIRRWVSAALAEILLNSAAGTSFSGTEKEVVTRELRLLLSVAVWRTLRGDPDAVDDEGDGVAKNGRRPPVGRTVHVAADASHVQPALTERLDKAREQVATLLTSFARALGDDGLADRAEGDGVQTGAARSPLLVSRVVGAIDAFGDDCVVVAVAGSARGGPATYSVRLPDRPTSRHPLHCRPTPCATVELDLLAPSAHADRQVLIRLADGVKFVQNPDGPARTDVRTTIPRALNRFTDLWGAAATHTRGESLSGAERCLAAVALAHADIAQDVFRHHGTGAGDALQSDFQAAYEHLQRLGSPAVGGEPGAKPDPPDGGRRGEDEAPLRRRTRPEAVNPRTVLIRLDAIDNPVLRGGVESARVTVDVVAEDPDTLRTARFTGRMSLLILLAMGVGLFAVDSADGQVLATLLTLFAAVQASRIEHPDRATLRGLLTSSSSWIVPLAIAPSILLGVGLAFFPGQGGWHGPLGLSGLQLAWAVVCSFQAGLQFLLERGPLTEGSRSPTPRLRLETEPRPDHGRVAVLHGTWWRGTTGAALLLGRPAHAYLVHQADGGTLPTLLGPPRARTCEPDRAPSSPFPLLRRFRRDPATETTGPAVGPPNILAMLRSGTMDQSLTFLVLREQPLDEWLAASGRTVRGFELSPDRLIPFGSPAGLFDVFLGLPRRRSPLPLDGHPLRVILTALRDAGWQVSEIQLPVPSPSGGDPARRWLRIRIALYDDDLCRLKGVLDDLAGRALRGEAGPDIELLIRGTPQSRPQRLFPEAADRSPVAGTPDRHPVRAAELDVLDIEGVDPQQREWEVVGLCSYTRAGIETTLLDWLAEQRPGLRLAGLTTSRLHGTTVIFLLGHQPGGRTEHDRPLSGLVPDHEDDLAEVLHDAWVPTAALGGGAGPGDDRVLQVHVQSRDVPGTLSEVLETLRGALGRLVLPHQHETPDLSVWHLRLEVAEGQVARCRFTIRLPQLMKVTDDWSPAVWERARRLMEREVRETLTDQLRAAGTSGGDPGQLVDTVLSIRLVRVEEVVPDSIDVRDCRGEIRLIEPGEPVDGEDPGEPGTGQAGTGQASTER